MISFHESKKYETILHDIKKAEENDTSLDEETEKQFDLYLRIFCKLGHFNLLLEEYSKGLFLI